MIESNIRWCSCLSRPSRLSQPSRPSCQQFFCRSVLPVLHSCAQIYHLASNQICKFAPMYGSYMDHLGLHHEGSMIVAPTSSTLVQPLYCLCMPSPRCCQASYQLRKPYNFSAPSRAMQWFREFRKVSFLLAVDVLVTIYHSSCDFIQFIFLGWF